MNTPVIGWIRPKPMVHMPGCEEPDVVELCDCGSNVQCRTCGWGSMVTPCSCQRERIERNRTA